MPLRPIAAISLPTELATQRLAASLAPQLAPGDVILLSGPIGAGKSVFARALIQARLLASGQSEDVPSPTYTLVQAYDDGTTEIWHADLYRLDDGADLSELGLDEAFETAVCLVEWPERMGTRAPPGALWVRLEAIGDTGRRATFLSDDPARWDRANLRAAAGAHA